MTDVIETYYEPGGEFEEPSLKKRHKQAIILVIIGLISIFVLSPISRSEKVNAHFEKSISQKQKVSLELMGATTAGSVTVSLLPGDVGSAVSEQLAQLSGKFMVVLGVLIIEKFLLSIAGTMTFTYLLPIAIGLGLFYIYRRQAIFKVLAIKVAIFALFFVALVPASLQISDLVDQKFVTEIQETSQKVKADDADIKVKQKKIETDQNFLQKIESGITDFFSKTGRVLTAGKEKAVNMLNTLTQEVTRMIVTTCVIPILTFIVFGFVIKILFGFDLAIGTRLNTTSQKGSHAVKKIRIKS